jgi:hypothetical protein
MSTASLKALTVPSVSQVGADFLIGHFVAQLNDDSLILSFFFFPNKNVLTVPRH